MRIRKLLMDTAAWLLDRACIMVICVCVCVEVIKLHTYTNTYTDTYAFTHVCVMLCAFSSKRLKVCYIMTLKWLSFMVL